MAHPTFRGFHRGSGDESNSPVLEILVGGEGTETYPRAVHVAQSSDADSDWNITATAHPVWLIHSGTTATTDYISFTHDGATATWTVAGGDLDLNSTGVRFLCTAGTALFSAAVACEPSALLGTVWAWTGAAGAVAATGSAFLMIVDDGCV